MEKSKFLEECLRRGILIGSRQMGVAHKMSDWDIVVHYSVAKKLLKGRKTYNNAGEYRDTKWGLSLMNILKTDEGETETINLFVFRNNENLTRFIKLNNYVLDSGVDLHNKDNRIKLYEEFLNDWNIGKDRTVYEN